MNNLSNGTAWHSENTFNARGAEILSDCVLTYYFHGSITGRLKWPQATCLGKLCVKRLLLVLKGAWNRVYPLLCPPLITEEEKTLRQSHIFPGLLESICFSFDNFSLVPWWRLDRPGKSSNRLSLSKGRKFLLISGNLYSQERPIKIENSGRDVTLIFQVKRFMRWKWIQAY